MKEIGGYFELELPRSQEIYLHSDGIKVNSGRHALEFILRCLGNNVKKIWLPYYSCEVVTQPIQKLGLDYGFYPINNHFEIDEVPNLGSGEYLIVNNYFGIKDSYIRSLVPNYGDRIIIDNAQAWYCEEIQAAGSLYSPRKFFGLPDGGVAYVKNNNIYNLETDSSSGRCSHLLKRIDMNAGMGYADFRNNSAELNETPLLRMSGLTERILSSIDFNEAKERRIANYRRLHEALGKTNLLNLPQMDSFTCPMVYPLWTDDKSLRQRLIENRIFVATYWPNVFHWCDVDSIEYRMAEHIIPLPIDQRYGEEDMIKILDVINYMRLE